MLAWSTILLSIVIIKLFMGDLDTAPKKKVFLILSGLILVFFIGSRNALIAVGTDLNNYYNFYAAAIKMTWKDFSDYMIGIDKGYVILNQILSILVPWPQFIVYFVAAVTTLLVFRFIYINTKDVFLGVLIFLSLGTFSFFLTGFRQSIAIGLCLWAFEYIKERKLIKFLLVVILAIIMHQTAIVFLPFYYLGNRKASAINNILTFTGFFGAVFFTEFLLEWGNELFDKNFVMIGTESAFGGVLNIAVYAATLIAAGTFLNYHRNTKESEQIKLVFQMLLLGTGIYILRFQALVMERVAFYFIPAIAVLLPNVMTEIRQESGKREWYLLIISICIFLYGWRFYNYSYDYVFFWRLASL